MSAPVLRSAPLVYQLSPTCHACLRIREFVASHSPNCWLRFALVHVITRKRLNEFAEEHPDAKSSLAHWSAIMRKSRFLNFVQLRETFPPADQFGNFTVLS